MNEAINALLTARQSAVTYRAEQAAKLTACETTSEQCGSEIARMDTRIKDIEQALAKLGYKEKKDGNAA